MSDEPKTYPRGRLILMEHPSSSYAPRTFHNAKTADITIAFAIDFTTGGEKLTAKAAGDRLFKLDLKNRDEPIPDTLLDFVEERVSQGIEKEGLIINVAGNGVYTLYRKLENANRTADDYVLYILTELSRRFKIWQVISGGQTGVDTYGARAGLVLQKLVVVTYPKGYLIRLHDGRDICQNPDDVVERIVSKCVHMDEATRQYWKNSYEVWPFNSGRPSGLRHI